LLPRFCCASTLQQPILSPSLPFEHCQNDRYPSGCPKLAKYGPGLFSPAFLFLFLFLFLCVGRLRPIGVFDVAHIINVPNDTPYFVVHSRRVSKIQSVN
jgi:hypothetical protein